MISDAQWTAAVAYMTATWRDCHLADDPDAARVYQSHCAHWEVGRLRRVIDVLASRKDRFPSVADFSAVGQEVAHEARLQAEAANLPRIPAGRFPLTVADKQRVLDEMAGQGYEVTETTREWLLSLATDAEPKP